MQLRRSQRCWTPCRRGVKEMLLSHTSLLAEDTFSRHFESIMESPTETQRTQYNSLDEHSARPARQIVQLSFAPLAHVTGQGGGEGYRAQQSEVGIGGQGTAVRSHLLSSAVMAHLQLEKVFDNQAVLPQVGEKARLATDSELDQDLQANKAWAAAASASSSHPRCGNRRRLASISLADGRKSGVARHLSKNNDFSRMVAEGVSGLLPSQAFAIDQLTLR
ncbi:PH and SEC7 domain-containing protein 1-like isoform X2 [Lates japonicus]|uniref:PH and SEC7 domain-containing protein 1-like isoform X2 n=1 Tax=Lates japonicus TaxID=270547 RepID=A0AAD3RKX0_LATJO|nr:PH and SEC7 domain-containing protein 1-like isoform X2 [Lates japonicus]